MNVNDENIPGFEPYVDDVDHYPDQLDRDDGWEGSRIARCEKCKRVAEFYWEEIGIGPYEWGDQRGLDIGYVLLSFCCRSEMEGEFLEEADLDDQKLRDKNDHA